MHFKQILVGSLLLSSSLFFSQNNLPLIPYPQQISVSEGKFNLNEKTVIYAPNNSNEAQMLQFQIKSKLGITLPISTKNTGKKEGIVLDINSKLKDKTYTLDILPNTAIINGKTAQDVLYGIQTLLQLIPVESKSKAEIANVKIVDSPKFDYRGMHLDVCRHFFTVDEVKQYLDYLSAYKYNKFHWHLTDDQGWRIEIKKYPKLTQIGGFRDGSMVGAYSDMKFDDKRYGGFYTQEQIKEVVAYAKKLHIDVIPEIEMPGHAQAALAAYPEYACTKGPFEVWKQWGVSENIFCPKEETFKFLEDVMDEVIPLFPYEYVHIGGDEAPKKVWKESKFVQDLIKEKGLKDELEMQSYFITRMEKYINSKGKQIIGWDEILEGGLAPNATVMSWTGIEGGIHAAKTQHKAIMTPTGTNYFDYYQGNPETEPIAIGGDLRLDKVYGYNPIPKELNAEQAKYIWGTQANLWTEYVLDFPHVQHMIFPRMMALSEVAWGTSKPSEYKNFENRVLDHFKVLEQKGIRYSKAIFEVSDQITPSKDGTITYTLSAAKDPKNIRYTLDGSKPTINSNQYNQPLNITKSAIINSAYFEGGSQKSPLTVREFRFTKSTGKPIQLVTPPSEAYSVGGAFTLVDGITGNPKNHGKSWLGFSGKDCLATIDLLKNEKISNVKLNSLDRRGSWIYFPSQVNIYTSTDNKTFKKVASLTSEEIQKSEGKMEVKFAEQNTRYVKVEVLNYGVIPDGKEGAGQKSWLFVDEISIN